MNKKTAEELYREQHPELSDEQVEEALDTGSEVPEMLLPVSSMPSPSVIAADVGVPKETATEKALSRILPENAVEDQLAQIDQQAVGSEVAGAIHAAYERAGLKVESVQIVKMAQKKTATYPKGYTEHAKYRLENPPKEDEDESEEKTAGYLPEEHLSNYEGELRSMLRDAYKLVGCRDENEAWDYMLDKFKSRHADDEAIDDKEIDVLIKDFFEMIREEKSKEASTKKTSMQDDVRRKGNPRTEEERAKRHKDLTGEDEPPPRGTGLASTTKTAAIYDLDIAKQGVDVRMIGLEDIPLHQGTCDVTDLINFEEFVGGLDLSQQEYDELIGYSQDQLNTKIDQLTYASRKTASLEEPETSSTGIAEVALQDGSKTQFQFEASVDQFGVLDTLHLYDEEPRRVLGVREYSVSLDQDYKVAAISPHIAAQVVLGYLLTHVPEPITYEGRLVNDRNLEIIAAEIVHDKKVALLSPTADGIEQIAVAEDRIGSPWELMSENEEQILLRRDL